MFLLKVSQFNPAAQYTVATRLRSFYMDPKAHRMSVAPSPRTWNGEPCSTQSTISIHISVHEKIPRNTPAHSSTYAVETLDYHLKRCATWFQDIALATSLHQLSVINLIYYPTSIISLHYYQPCPITFCTLITPIICLTRATLHQEHCARTLLTMPILAVCIPDTTWTSLRRLHPYTT